MNRVILVGVLYLAIGYATSYIPEAYGRSPWNYIHNYPPRPPTPSLCEMNWIDRTTKNCSMEVTCSDNTEVTHLETSFNIDPSRWTCIVEHEYNEREEVIDDVVKHINLKLIGNEPINLKFNENSDFLYRIKQLLLKDNPEDIPEDLYKLSALEDIQINKYDIDVLNLTRFMEFKELKKLNVSQNFIKDIETNNNNKMSLVSKLEILDLSHNLIENVVEFNKFASLKYLDLSHNAIKNINVLAFDGLRELSSLYLSHNCLLQIGNILSKLNNIKEVTLDHNEISAIEKLDFAGLDKIEKLNLSSNAIQFIQGQAFSSLTNLKELDLSCNKLNIIEKQLFKNSNKLCTLLLRNNNIETVELEAFDGKNITTFEIQNNAISGTINKGFQAINVQYLDLSNMKISLIGPNTFSSEVRDLNLSHNVLYYISVSAFLEAKNLKSLDLSFNQLLNFHIDFSSSKALSSLNLQHNRIREIKRSTFKNLNSLEILDLSDNWISEIENKSFTDLKNLIDLRLQNNINLKKIEIGIFDGLASLMFLDFSNSSISELQSEQFFDVKQLQTLNASHCQIEKIQYDAFKNLDSIVIIDISYNLLTEFSINNKDIAGVKVLFLAFNNIKSISDITFHALSELLHLELKNNNILQISDNAFSSLEHLRVLSLASNTDAEIHTKTFDNLSLKGLILRNITKRFNFEHTSNTKVSFLDLSFCDIKNLDNIFIHKLHVKKLVLKYNGIEQFDKHSFQNSSSLEFLDVSSNAISYIQPGTFLKLKNLKKLNLQGNNINKLELGVFEGLSNLQSLNLSNNIINSFNLLTIRNLRALKNISLDNNKLESIDLHSFIYTEITKVTIGGNDISCGELTKFFENQRFYNHARNFVVTAEVLDFHSENADGIACSQKTQNDQKTIVSPETNATYILAYAIEKLQETISNKISLHNSSDSTAITVKNNDTLQEPVKDVIKKILEGLKSSNDNNLQNAHSDVKSLAFITVACLVVIVVMYLTIFVPKMKHILLYRLKRSQRDIPLIRSGVELE